MVKEVKGCRCRFQLSHCHPQVQGQAVSSSLLINSLLGYNVEVPDSYEHLLLEVIDGQNHLFLRSNELAAAWNVLTPVLNEIDKKNIATELYELGGRGPVGAYHLLGKTWGSLGRGLAT
ncbi:hypothetical protein ACFXTH_010142 [Malus domestica]